MLASWACESGCFANNPSPDLQEGLGEMDLKPETLRYVVCATSDLLADASFDVESWIMRRVSEGFRATINAAILLGDGVCSFADNVQCRRPSAIRLVRDQRARNGLLIRRQPGPYRKPNARRLARRHTRSIWQSEIGVFGCLAKAITMQTDPYSAGWRSLFKFECRVGGATTCPNAMRLLRIK